MECWAKSLGDCGGGISREHIVSRNLFKDGAIIRGAPWARDPVVSIGSDDESMVVYNACVEHNSALSLLDTTAGSIQRRVEQMVRHAKDAEALARPRKDGITIDVSKIERWAIKTVVNVLSKAQPDLWRLGEAGPRGQVPDAYVRRVFQGQALPGKLGGYLIAEPNMTFIREHEKIFDIEFMNYTSNPSAVAGAHFRLAGIEFFLAFDSDLLRGARNAIRAGKISLVHGFAKCKLLLKYR